MENTGVKCTLQQITGFTDGELDVVMEFFHQKNFKKKTTIIEIGEVANEVFFVVKGCLRLYCWKDGQELSTYFFTENTFAGTYDSFISRKPTRIAMEALEDSIVLALSYQSLETLYEVFPKMNEFVRKSIEQRFVVLHDLFTSYLLNSPEERYVKLLSESPELLHRIPQHQIASFLGVTPVSLSRIRNRVAKK
ncbi:MAG: Crp/Fnr family transcriptional regulator [Saprospiraceae bacterium]|nr:Crp/Fnr family transcriptional regulator [Saprospiraceae bacterium]